MRGEHRRTRQPLQTRRGSSPHARGTPHLTESFGCDRGIIPACAGNTASRYAFRASSWDHPRMRGEHPLFDAKVGRWQGSSPHARGTLQARKHQYAQRRIIPACAGNTLVKCSNFKGYADTPPRFSFTFVLHTIREVAYISPLPYNEFVNGPPSQSARCRTNARMLC